VVWLAEEDLVRFATEGFLLVEGVVPDGLLAAAEEEVDRLATEVAPDGGDASQPGQHGWFLSPDRLPRCDDVLRHSPAAEITHELVAPNRLDHAFDHIQVATTVPPWSHVPGGPHIDGHGPDQDRPHSFTLLVGVLMTDQTAPGCGNLWVWPGSHRDHQRLFRARGPDALLATSGHALSLDPPPALDPAIELRGHRGDVLLAHYLLGHNKGGNTGDQVRKTIYYRLAVPGHTGRWPQTFLDIWTEYPPVQRASGPPGGQDGGPG
jgi:hypothetical protein